MTRLGMRIGVMAVGVLATAGVGFYAVAATQDTAPSSDRPDEVFGRVRDQVRSTLERLPNYTCLQTIVRTASRSTGRPGRSCDEILRDRKNSAARIEQYSWERIRLEVALADGKEVYSWAGESKFEDKVCMT